MRSLRAAFVVTLAACTHGNPPPSTQAVHRNPPEPTTPPVAPDATPPSPVVAPDAGSCEGPAGRDGCPPEIATNPPPPTIAPVIPSNPPRVIVPSTAQCPPRERIRAGAPCAPAGLGCYLPTDGCQPSGFRCTDGRWTEVEITCNPPMP